jgi:hypothetical protein
MGGVEVRWAWRVFVCVFVFVQGERKDFLVVFCVRVSSLVFFGVRVCRGRGRRDEGEETREKEKGRGRGDDGEETMERTRERRRGRGDGGYETRERRRWRGDDGKETRGRRRGRGDEGEDSGGAD